MVNHGFFMMIQAAIRPVIMICNVPTQHPARALSSKQDLNIIFDPKNDISAISELSYLSPLATFAFHRVLYVLPL